MPVLYWLFDAIVPNGPGLAIATPEQSIVQDVIHFLNNRSYISMSMTPANLTSLQIALTGMLNKNQYVTIVNSAVLTPFGNNQLNAQIQFNGWNSVINIPDVFAN